jgi:hypothetical protein
LKKKDSAPEGCGECGHCTACAKCGKPREIRHLVKKFKTEDVCKTKCQVEHHVEVVPDKSKKGKADCAVECCDIPATGPPVAEPPLPKEE